MEREGRMVARVVPDAKTVSLRPIVLENVERGSTVSTDELRSYGLLTKDGYRHGRVNHKQGEYARRENGAVIHPITPQRQPQDCTIAGAL